MCSCALPQVRRIIGLSCLADENWSFLLLVLAGPKQLEEVSLVVGREQHMVPLLINAPRLRALRVQTAAYDWPLPFYPPRPDTSGLAIMPALEELEFHTAHSWPFKWLFELMVQAPNVRRMVVDAKWPSDADSSHAVFSVLDQPYYKRLESLKINARYAPGFAMRIVKMASCSLLELDWWSPFEVDDQCPGRTYFGDPAGFTEMVRECNLTRLQRLVLRDASPGTHLQARGRGRGAAGAGAARCAALLPSHREVLPWASVICGDCC